eukprot:4179394-Amphidinium_carterae.1
MDERVHADDRMEDQQSGDTKGVTSARCGSKIASPSPRRRAKLERHPLQQKGGALPALPPGSLTCGRTKGLRKSPVLKIEEMCHQMTCLPTSQLKWNVSLETSG